MHFFITAVVNLTTDTSNSVWRCPKQHYWCRYEHDRYEHHRKQHGCTHIDNYICDGRDHCGGIDEKYCDQTVSPLD